MTGAKVFHSQVPFLMSVSGMAFWPHPFVCFFPERSDGHHALVYGSFLTLCGEVSLDWFAQECAERGEDYDIVKLREVGADETERIERKRKKKNPDQGFAGVWTGVE